MRTADDPVFRARNVRKAVTDGVEASAAWARGRPGVPFDSLAPGRLGLHGPRGALAAAAGGAVEGRYVLDPLHVKVDAQAGLALPVSLALTARVSYFSRPSFTDGVWLLSSRLAWQAFQGRILEVFLEGENLGNVRYEDVPGVPLPGRTASRASTSPGEARTDRGRAARTLGADYDSGSTRRTDKWTISARDPPRHRGCRSTPSSRSGATGTTRRAA